MSIQKNNGEKRIVIRMVDGLGNQLFQYALGRRLAHDRGANLYIDVSWYDPSRCIRPDRPLALMDFRIAGTLTTDERWASAWLPPTLWGRICWRVEQQFLSPQWRSYIQEDPHQIKLQGRAFDPRILRARINTYLFGWWVSPLYFAGIEDLLRNDLVLKDNPPNFVSPYLAKAMNSESVSIHIRRGDYLRYPDIGVLPRDYYVRAINYIRERVSKPQFIVFSDDLAGAKEILDGLGEFDYIDFGPGISPSIDLSLMAACRHHINANSTFSWWGAWLSNYPDKIVISPDKWFVGAGVEVEDVYPPEWTKLPVNS